MLNMYNAVLTHPSYSRLEIGEFLFAEYTRGTDQKMLPNWAAKDYFVQVITSTKTSPAAKQRTIAFGTVRAVSRSALGANRNTHRSNHHV